MTVRSPVRNLARRDVASHGASAAAGGQQDAPEASAIDYLDSLFQQDSPAESDEVVAAAPPAEDRQEADPPAAADEESADVDQSAAAGDGADVEVDGDDAVEVPANTFLAADARPLLLDVLGALAPVFRAAMLFPGPSASAEQHANVVGRLSTESVRLADAIARDCDPHEIDLSWMRRRAGAFAADIVASAWLTQAIRRGGGAPSVMAPEAGLEKIVAGIEAVRRAVGKSEAFRASAPGAGAAMFGLAPVLIEMQRYADLVEARMDPVEVTVDVDGAAVEIVAAINDEVERAMVKLRQYLPADAVADLAAELSAQAGGMAKVAWEGVVGAVLGPLDALETPAERMALLQDEQLRGCVPVDETIARLRTLMRRLVGSSEYAVKHMLGSAA